MSRAPAAGTIVKADTGVRRPRRRRDAEEARREALEAARDLLLTGGPAAVTLKAVAGRIGVTHVNLLHHFGSAAGLQSALMASMVRDLTRALVDAVTHLRSDAGAARTLIDQVFDAADAGGAGRLAAWLAVSGDLQHLEPIRQAISALVAAVHEKFADEGDAALWRIRRAVLFIAIAAFGDAVIGGPLRDMLGHDDDAARDIVAGLLPSFF
ncbi:MAG: TetR/AcrR family transcriptional regulator [Caulobacteraceae bacterium]